MTSNTRKIKQLLAIDRLLGMESVPVKPRVRSVIREACCETSGATSGLLPPPTQMEGRALPVSPGSPGSPGSVSSADDRSPPVLNLSGEEKLVALARLDKIGRAHV